MSKEKENNGGSFLDLFELGEAMFSNKETPEESNVKEVGSEIETIETSAPEIVLETKQEEVVPESNEIVEIEDISGIDTIVNELVTQNVLLFDEEKEYESSTEGLKELISETVEKRNQEFIDSYKNNLGEEAKTLLDILSNGGTVEDYLSLNQEVDFSKVPLIDKNGEYLEKNQMYLVQDWMEVQGYTKEEIEETLEDYKSSGLLHKQADIAKKKLISWQEESKASLIKEKSSEALKRKEEEIKAAKDFEKEVTSLTDIAGFSLTKEKAKKLHEFITVQDKSGKTKFQQSDSPENRLLYAFFAMEGFSKEKLVKDVATSQAIKLKKQLSNYADSAATPKSSGNKVTYDKTKDIVSNISWMGL
jgi:hypothetical protein